MDNNQTSQPKTTGTYRFDSAKIIGINWWLWLMAGIWSIAIILSITWNNYQVKTLVMDKARSELRANFFKDVTFRKWASKHGGVYVPVTEDTQPDPFVAFLPERDVLTPSGRTLTLINPALMMRQFNEMARHEYGANGNLSSLKPLNPNNTPDPWEAKALKQFYQGIDEVTEVSYIQGDPYLRLIRPMVMTQQCLHCHNHQGYKLGDIAGGVSVSIPLTKLNIAAEKRMKELGLGHTGLWLLGVIGVSIGGRKLKQRINESNHAYYALSESEERIRSTLRSSLDAIISTDTSDRITSWNQQAETIFGWSADEVLGKSLAEHIIPLHYRKMHLEGVRTYLQTGQSTFLNRRTELTALNKDNVEFPIELTVAPITIDGKPAFSAFIRDISERKGSELQIKKDYHSQRVIASVLEISMRSISFKEKLEQSLEQILSTPWLTVQSRGVIFIADNETKKIVMAAQYGLAEEIQERCRHLEFGECLCGKAAEKQQVVFASHLTKDHTITYEGIKDHGHYTIPIMLEDNLMGVLNLYLDAGHVKHDEEIQFLNIIANTLGNVIHRHQSDEKLRYYAFYDELTDLPNRTLFFNRLNQYVEHAKRHSNYQFAILFMDLDRFKNINDSLGHTVGDNILKHTAEILLDCVRSDAMVARLGGDEFAILLDDIDDEADAYRVAERIHDVLLKPMVLQHHEVFTSASIGIAIGTDKYDSPVDILRDADTAMYRAKQKADTHTEIFDEKMHANAVSVLKLETELRHAMEREEFCLHYQPIVSTNTGYILGFEALLRWNHPERGLISPTEFITVAEETGLINEISYWVLREACRQNQAWNSDGTRPYPLYVSVNLSAVQFKQNDLVERIETELKSLSFDAKNLRLEITESALIDNPTMVNQILLDIKNLGIHLYLDDFGTGYSSLSYLHNFPFDTLKIDRSFVSKLGSGIEHIGMVNTIIAVARNFNMGVIAEGVENEMQIEHLRKLNCENLQGYYFSKPLSTEDTKTLLSRTWVFEEEKYKGIS